jgi:hypothetical protein
MVACIDFFEMSEICRPIFIVRHSTVSMTLIIVIMFSLPNFIDEMKRKV